MPNSVRFYDSTMAGAPELSGTAGALITLLDACLVTGWTTITLDSLIIADDVATASYSTGHGLAMVGTTGPVIRIADATLPALNGDWRVTITSGTAFTFATSGIADQTALGTITARRAPAGWEKRYSVTNLAAYARTALAATAMLLRVDDAGTGSAAYARVIGYESMTGMDSDLVGPFPTDAQQSGGGYWHKSNGANATARPWSLMGDDQGFYLFVQQDGNTTGQIGMMFSDINSDHASDAYRTLLVFGTDTSAGNGGRLPLFNAAAGRAMPRSYAGTGTAIQPLFYGAQFSAAGMGYAGATYPNPGNNYFLCSGVDVWDSSSVARGILPGLYAPLHAGSAFTDATLVTDIEGLPGRTLIIKKLVNGGTQYAGCIDITGPWR